jgi:hypothetical protein
LAVHGHNFKAYIFNHTRLATVDPVNVVVPVLYLELGVGKGFKAPVILLSV